MSSEALHESESRLSAETINCHRAFTSLIEELEAVDWYNQRAEVTEDPQLRAILEHNRDEEKEHASMILEWLRRHDPALDENLRQYLFSEGSIVKNEAEATGAAPSSAGSSSSGGVADLGIGSLRNKEGF